MSKQWFEEVDPIWEDNPFAIAAVIAGIIVGCGALVALVLEFI